MRRRKRTNDKTYLFPLFLSQERPKCYLPQAGGTFFAPWHHLSLPTHALSISKTISRDLGSGGFGSSLVLELLALLSLEVALMGANDSTGKGLQR